MRCFIIAYSFAVLAAVAGSAQEPMPVVFQVPFDDDAAPVLEDPPPIPDDAPPVFDDTPPIPPDTPTISSDAAASEDATSAGEVIEGFDPAPTPNMFDEPIIYESVGDLGGGGSYFGCGPGCQGWLNVEYLVWWTAAMQTPTLVSTSPSGTAQTAAGVLDQGATPLFGGDLLRDVRSGGRIRFGKWLDECRRFGIEAEYLALGEISDGFSATSTGDPILARPFFNALTNQEDAELVAFPGVLSGTVTAAAEGTLHSGGARLLWNMCCDGGSIDSCSSHSRVDLLLGYRFLRLDESLVMTEDLTSQLSTDPGTFAIVDRFRTANQFHGGEIGLLRNESYGHWSLELLFKVALGNVHEQVVIDGSTVITDDAGTEEFTGGLLAQRTNSGLFSRNRYALVPELGLTLGYDLSDCWRATFGYTVIYWDRVVRPGDQIDRQVNPNLLAPELVPLEGPLRPEFEFKENGFWAQGMSFGLSYTW